MKRVKECFKNSPGSLQRRFCANNGDGLVAIKQRVPSFHGRNMINLQLNYDKNGKALLYRAIPWKEFLVDRDYLS